MPCQAKKHTWLKKQKHKNNEKCVDKFGVFAILSLSPLMAHPTPTNRKKTICH
jgi:hypothetical protein